MTKPNTPTKKKKAWSSQAKTTTTPKARKTPSIKPEKPTVPSALKMPYKVAPGQSRPGPYCEVLFPTMLAKVKYTKEKQEDGKVAVVPVAGPKRAKTTLGWVRVLSGDNLNGIGTVHHSHHPEVQDTFPVGTKVRFAGGSRQAPPKVIETVNA